MCGFVGGHGNSKHADDRCALIHTVGYTGLLFGREDKNQMLLWFTPPTAFVGYQPTQMRDKKSKPT